MHKKRQEAKGDEWLKECRCAVSRDPVEPSAATEDRDALEEERLKVLGSLIPALAHEFNNPLCGVDNVLERMRRRPDLSDAERQLLQLAREQCGRMQQLLKAVQEFAFSPFPHETTFDLHQALAAVQLLGQKQLQRHGIALRSIHQPTPLMVHGTGSQIKLMLLHLLQSCCRFLPLSGCMITMDTSSDETWARIVLCFQVADESTAALAHCLAAVVHADTSVDSNSSLLQTVLEWHRGVLHQVVPSSGSGALILSLPLGREYT